MALAGLWEHWCSPDDEQQEMQTFTIATCEPSDQMRPIHNRMPVILAPTAFDSWLHEAFTAPLISYAGLLSVDPPALAV
jgi:putative SOS response-associated peptidase YedK